MRKVNHNHGYPCLVRECKNLVWKKYKDSISSSLCIRCRKQFLMSLQGVNYDMNRTRVILVE